MTITDADLERIEAAWAVRAESFTMAHEFTRLAGECVPALIAAVREARQTCTCEGRVHPQRRFAKLGLMCLDCGGRVKE